MSSRGEKIRICLDPGDLNKAVKREHYPIPTVEEIAAKIPDAKVFTVLDAKSGYFQMNLDYESSLLTTMNSPVMYLNCGLKGSLRCAILGVTVTRLQCCNVESLEKSNKKKTKTKQTETKTKKKKNNTKQNIRAKTNKKKNSKKKRL